MIAGHDLFGNPNHYYRFGSDIPVDIELNWQREVIISRSAWMQEYAPEVDRLILDSEDLILLNQSVSCFILGLDAANIICCVAFLERILTDAVEIRIPERRENRGLGSVIAAAEKLELLHPYLISRIKHLNKVRINFSHEKGPDSEYRLFRRALKFARAFPNASFPEDEILRNDSREAICLARGIAARMPRYFPRLDLPGHPSIRESLLD